MVYFSESVIPEFHEAYREEDGPSRGQPVVGGREEHELQGTVHVGIVILQVKLIV